jgi:hypothetical protein
MAGWTQKFCDECAKDTVAWHIATYCIDNNKDVTETVRTYNYCYNCNYGGFHGQFWYDGKSATAQQRSTMARMVNHRISRVREWESRNGYSNTVGN